MIVLDENILDGQRLLLEAWRISVRQIGHDVARKGLQDQDIVVALRRLRKPTFITRDADFYCRELGAASYCLVVICGSQYEVASFVRRLLRHPGFNTHSKRMGKVVRVAPVGLRFWELHQQAERTEAWKSRSA